METVGYSKSDAEFKLGFTIARDTNVTIDGDTGIIQAVLKNCFYVNVGGAVYVVWYQDVCSGIVDIKLPE